MTHCPNCGSTNIQVVSNASKSIRNSMLGGYLVGNLGAAIGAAATQNSSNVCVNCGESWGAREVYNLTQFMKKYLDFDLDLSRADHREYLKLFTTKLANALRQYKADQDWIAAVGAGPDERQKLKNLEALKKLYGVNWELLGVFAFSLLSIILLLSAISSLASNSFNTRVMGGFFGGFIGIGSSIAAYACYVNRDNYKDRIRNQHKLKPELNRAEKTEMRIKTAISEFLTVHPAPS